MTTFDPTKTKLLHKEEWYLVKCSRFSESGYEIAQWDGEGFISQANNDEISDFVEGYKLLKQ